MSTQHPITPPPGLVASLRNSAPQQLQAARETWLITHAYAAGADMELEACCQWLFEDDYLAVPVSLRAARRPKPPSMKDEALAVLDDCSKHLNAAHENVIRRALEALDE